MANPNPSPETRFKPGNPGGGKTSEQKRLEYEAAEMAARARHRILSVITEKMEQGVDPEEYLRGDVLKLFKDSEDRAHGTPASTTTLRGDENAPLHFEGIILAPLEAHDETEH